MVAACALVPPSGIDGRPRPYVSQSRRLSALDASSDSPSRRGAVPLASLFAVPAARDEIRPHALGRAALGKSLVRRAKDSRCSVRTNRAVARRVDPRTARLLAASPRVGYECDEHENVGVGGRNRTRSPSRKSLLACERRSGGQRFERSGAAESGQSDVRIVQGERLVGP